MPFFERDDTRIYFEECGAGYPVLLFAPGAMRSAIRLWHLPRPAPFDPTVEFAGDFRVIAMDQRNAGQSDAPIRKQDGWQTYAEDHLGLLDFLGVRSVHLLGACIGASFALRLMETAPQRVTSAVLQQPIGLAGDNLHEHHAGFDTWIDGLPADHRPDAEVASAIRDRMFGGDFVFSVTREFVRHCSTPMLVLPGHDVPHPESTAREIVDLAPHAELRPDWRNGIPEVVEQIRTFFKVHTPGGLLV